MENGAIVQVPTLPDNVLSASINNWCIANRQAAVIGCHKEDPRESAAVHELRKKMNIGSTCCVPIYRRDKLAGALSISRNRVEGDFDENDIDVFTALVNQLSTALERYQLAGELKHQAFHDPLTALPNRHSFELALDDAIKDAQASELSLSVLFINLDGFKVINDTHGNAAGDALLSLVSQSFSECIEPCDVLARVGGLRVAIDDFGTGYSSLSYLQDLPLDVLKIDRAFVIRLTGEAGEQSLVKTIQLLASGLDLETVAEGVETIEQKEAVEQLGCDLIQGYFYSPPVSPDQILAVVDEIQSHYHEQNLKPPKAA